MITSTLKKLTLPVIAVVAMLVLVILLRTLLLTPPVENQSESALVPVNIDQHQSINRLSQAIQHTTIAQLLPGNAEQPAKTLVDGEVFNAFHQFLQFAFPMVHQYLALDKVGGYSLLYQWIGTRPELPPVVLLAHQDVVPAALNTFDHWSYPPFSGAVSDGFIWGRGTLDDKSSLMAILEAVESLLNVGWRPVRTIYLAFGHDEEVGGSGARLVAQKLRELSIKPAMVLDEGGFIVKGLIPGVSRPVALTGIAEKGYLSIRLIARGQPGHSSMPPPQTAAGIISAAVAKLESHPPASRLDGATELMFATVSPFMPFLNRLVFANLWLFEPLVLKILEQKVTTNATIRTTQAVTMVNSGSKDNVLPAQATAVLNFRLLPGDSADSVIEHIARTVGDDRIQIETLPFGSSPAPLSDVSSFGFEAIEQAVNSVFRDDEVIFAPYLTIGATDARHFTAVSDNQFRFLPILLNPDDLPRIHGVNERISIDGYLGMIQFYTEVLQNLSLDESPR